jgi:hypothetical protein
VPSWLSHPRYVPARDALIAKLRSEHYRFRKLDPVVFLCGANQSATRERLRGYLEKQCPAALLFYAEGVWAEIASHSQLSALEMEAQLAGLSDLVIVIVESPGTFAEIGAFSISEPLRKKLLAICEIRYRGSKSFLETGPIFWIDQESAFRPTIWVPLDRVLEAADEIVDRLERIPKPTTTRLKALTDSPKHLLFFTCDLVAVVQPATVDIVAHYIENIVGPQPAGAVASLLGLAVTMELVVTRTTTIGGRPEKVYYRQPSAGLATPFHHRRRLDLPTERARHVSVLQLIPDALLAMEAIADDGTGR